MKDTVGNNHFCLGGESRAVEMQAPVLVQEWTVKWPFCAFLGARCCTTPPGSGFLGRW